MRNLLLLMLCAFSSASIYAESKVLPPVIDNSIYPNASGTSFGSAAPSTNAMYEVLGRLEQLQLEVQQLRGMVEEQSQTISHLKKRQENIYSDLDLRLQQLNGGGALVNGTDSAESVSPNTISADEQNYDSTATVTETGSVETVVEPPALSDKERYQTAYEMLRNGHNSKAITEFEALIAESPAGEFADNSQYWLGEAYKVNRNLEGAKRAFLKVVNEYAGSPKVPDALLKLGYIEFEQNNMAKARDYLTQLTVSHPDTTAAHLASKKLMQMGNMQF